MSGSNLAREIQRALLLAGKLDDGTYHKLRGPNTELGKRERTINRRQKARANGSARQVPLTPKRKLAA